MRGWMCAVLVAALALALVGATQPVPAQAEEGVPLPVLMYHALSRDASSWNDYVISPEVLEADLAALKARGYTPVLPSQVVAFVREGEPLPEKPVMITLDDGFRSHLTELVDVLERQDAVALVSVVGAYAQQADEMEEEARRGYAYLTGEEIQKLVGTGRVEVGNHSFDLHALGQRRGAMRCAKEDMESYRHVLTHDARKAQDYLAVWCGAAPQVYTYPYGLISDGADAILQKEGFAMTLSCYERVTRLTHEEDCLLSVGRFNRPAFESTEAFLRRCGIA